MYFFSIFKIRNNFCKKKLILFPYYLFRLNRSDSGSVKEIRTNYISLQLLKKYIFLPQYALELVQNTTRLTALLLNYVKIR